MPVIAAAFLATLIARPAEAHGPALPGTPHLSWNLDPLVLGPLLLIGLLYGRGVRRLWARAGAGRGVSRAAVAAFVAGQSIMLVALVSPLDALGGVLLSAHMVQHALLVAVAPPLLLLGRPGAALAWGLPARRRRSLLAAASWRALARLGNALSRPLPAASLHGAALWLWHAPGLFDAAVRDPWVHSLEHATFFGTALLFWRAVLGADRAIAAALGAAFATLAHGGLLGALITLAPRPLYGAYGAGAAAWGLTALEDQQLAGLLMWVPMGLVYLAACLALAGRLIADTPRAWRGPPPGRPVALWETPRGEPP